jgi:lipopolysaccharide heptosyltransferase II
MARAFLRFVDRSFGKLLVRAMVAFDRIRAALGGGRRPGQDAAAGAGPRNILVIKLVGLGDTVLMLTPLARLRREFPEARITALVTPLSVGVLSAQPSVDETVVYDVFGKDRGLPGIVRVVRLLRARDFDCVIDFEQHFQMTSVVAYLTGAPARIGFFYTGSPRKGLFTDPVFLNPDGHMVDAYMSLLHPVGIDSPGVESLETIVVPEENEKAVETWLAKQGIGSVTPLVGIHSGSGIRAPVRRWGGERFAEIIRRLRRDRDAAVVLTGGSDERDRVRDIMDLAGVDGVYNAAGDLSILETAALMRRCDLFISNDTGPLHMAAAMGTPTIGLFGPNSPTRYAPVGKNNRSIFKGVHCSPCIQIHRGRIDDCSDGICVKQITVDEVWDAVLEYDLGTETA